MKKLLNWIIVLLAILIFAVTTPKSFEAYNVNPGYYKINNYIIFSTCSASYENGRVYKINKIGILGFIINVRK